MFGLFFVYKRSHFNAIDSIWSDWMRMNFIWMPSLLLLPLLFSPNDSILSHLTAITKQFHFNFNYIWFDNIIILMLVARTKNLALNFIINVTIHSKIVRIWHFTQLLIWMDLNRNSVCLKKCCPLMFSKSFRIIGTLGMWEKNKTKLASIHRITHLKFQCAIP